MAGKTKFKLRSNLVTNSRLQLTLLAYAIFLSVFIAAVSLGFQILTREYSEYFQSHLMVVLVIAVVLFYAVVIFFGLAVTNRVAGPLYRLQKHMEGIVAGEPITHLSFREKDYFSEILAPYNEILTKVKQDGKKEK